MHPAVLSATPEYSASTGQGCKACHTDPMAGRLSVGGLEFAASGYVWPPEGGYRVIGPMRKTVRLAVGLFHIVAAFLWFGTILYVHILLRPAYAEKGLPKGEMGIGIVSMGIVGVTGILLTASRIKGMDVLFSSPWGIVLSLKMVFYLIMVSSAVFIVVFVGPRLKKPGRTEAIPQSCVFDPLTLSAFDGMDGRQGFIAYKRNVYEVTGLKLWKSGRHVKHAAGTDLTEVLSNAPHGEEKLNGLRVIGSYDISGKPEKTVYQKMFYFIAYMNLGIVFLVLITIAYWRWGI
ncbi:MAG: hypothetical protein Q8J64_03165 [Thermodesulfovibrionales bacterium]|nr:hypothetical protein [Thermodesulfovibrionales bacterium]